MPKTRAIEYKPYTLKAYWFNRTQNAQECAGSLSNFLRSLKDLETPFINWNYFNTKEKIEPIPLDVDEIRKQLLLPGNGAKRGVKPEETMPIMGFDVLLFSAGKNSERVTLNMTYGVSDGEGWNRCCIDLPTKGGIATQALQTANLIKLMEVVVRAWHPDWAVIDYFDYSDPDRSVNYIPVYWLVYLSEQRGKIPHLPSASTVGSIEGYGNYVITTPDPFTRDCPDHLEIASQVRDFLAQARLLDARPSSG